jgi:glucosylglycerate synthase
VELDTISQPELEQLERVGTADVVIGILDGDTPGSGGLPGRDALKDTAEARMREALAKFSTPLRAVVVSHNGMHTAAAAEPAETAPSPVVFACSLPAPVPGETPQQGIANAYRKVFAVGGKLGARACGLAASTPQKSSPQWIYRLIQPVLNLGFDLVAPCYTRQKMEGLLNRSVLAPLHRALYGEQLQNPMGPDFGISGKFLQQLLRQGSTRRYGTEGNTLASIAVSAAFGGCQVCESQLGIRSQRPTDWGNLSSLLAEILGAVFVEMEGRAAYWQSIRGSRVLPRFGSPDAALLETTSTPSLDVQGMHESFQLGTQNLQDVWGLILPPTTLLELRRMSRLSKDQFRFADQVWARVVYDFALGHRLRIISRDHLLRSFTPLYLGWIASYALEIQSAGVVDADSRFEQLSKAFEENKSYLVSRWRWPDRFNP